MESVGSQGNCNAGRRGACTNAGGGWDGGGKKKCAVGQKETADRKATAAPLIAAHGGKGEGKDERVGKRTCLEENGQTAFCTRCGNYAINQVGMGLQSTLQPTEKSSRQRSWRTY